MISRVQINFPSYTQIFIKIKNYFLTKLSSKIRDVYRFFCKYIKNGDVIKSRERGENIGRDRNERNDGIAGSLETQKFLPVLPVSWSFEYTMASTRKTLFNSLRDEICFAADCSMKYYPLGSVAIKWRYYYTSMKLYDHLCPSIFSKHWKLLQFPLYIWEWI